MILTSLRDNQQYFWIKVPRTATFAYHNFFIKYYDGEIGCKTHDPALGKLHTHYTYLNLCKLYKKTLPGISVVRHPLVRFISGLHQLKVWAEEKKLDVSFLDNTESCIEYLTKYFNRNCSMMMNYEDMFLSEEDSFISAFFRLQISFVYHPKVKYFYYENIGEFNEWISENLGYDISLLTRDNQSNKKLLSHIDFSDPRFIKQVENMFYDDYKILGYPLQYLT